MSEIVKEVLDEVINKIIQDMPETPPNEMDDEKAKKKLKNERRRLYYNKNIVKEREKSKSYYHRNKERFSTKNECPCGGRYTSVNKNIHYGTRGHLNWVRWTSCNNELQK